MKKLILLSVLLLTALNFSNAQSIPLEKKYPNDVPTRPRVPMLVPLTVDLFSTDLYLSFTSTIGIIRIAVTDSNGIIVYQESIDTDTNIELFIPLDSWESGEYDIEIIYGSITLLGYFGL